MGWVTRLKGNLDRIRMSLRDLNEERKMRQPCWMAVCVRESVEGGFRTSALWGGKCRRCSSAK